VAATAADGQTWQLGGSGNDTIQSGNDNATVSGGRGDDDITLLGSGNHLLYAIGDGADRIATAAVAHTGNVLKLNGVTANDLKLGLGAQGELTLQVGSDAHDTLSFRNFNPAAVQAMRPFERIEFDDGSTLTYDALLAQGFAIGGTAGADTLTGTNLDDTLNGGAGADTYLLALGGGADTVIDGGSETNTVRLGGVLTPDLLRADRRGNDLVVAIRNTGDSLTLKDYYGTSQSWQLQSPDGSSIALADWLANPDTLREDAVADAWSDAKLAAQSGIPATAAANGWQSLGNSRYPRIRRGHRSGRGDAGPRFAAGAHGDGNGCDPHRGFQPRCAF
jgi:Ca2+-binding RTX toxin-like protein